MSNSSKKTHDTTYAGHPSVQRMMGVIVSKLCLTKNGNDIEGLVKTCLMCQLDKTEWKKEAGLRQL